MMKNVIGIIGLGYVGLPLGVAFGKKFRTIGFDIDQKRVNDLKKLFDKTNEIESKELEYVLNENVIENDLNGKIRTAIIGEQSCRKKNLSLAS